MPAKKKAASKKKTAEEGNQEEVRESPRQSSPPLVEGRIVGATISVVAPLYCIPLGVQEQLSELFALFQHLLSLSCLS